jgi:hypothetical protein
MLDNPENWRQQKEQVAPVLMAWILFKYVEALKKLDLPTFSNQYQEHSRTKIPSKTLALYVFYRESKNEYPELEGMNRKQISEKLADEFGLSANHFRQDLAMMKQKEKRLVRENILRFSAVIELLDNYPNAKKYAEDELKMLENSH